MTWEDIAKIKTIWGNLYSRVAIREEIIKFHQKQFSEDKKDLKKLEGFIKKAKRR